MFPKLQSLPNARFRLTVLHFSRVLLSSTSLVCGDSCQSPAQFEPYTSSTDLQQERSIIDQKTELATERHRDRRRENDDCCCRHRACGGYYGCTPSDCHRSSCCLWTVTHLLPLLRDCCACVCVCVCLSSCCHELCVCF